MTLSIEPASVPAMARPPAEDTGAWNFRDIPRGLMQRVKMAAAYEGKTVKQWLMDFSQNPVRRDGKEGDFAEGKVAGVLVLKGGLIP